MNSYMPKSKSDTHLTPERVDDLIDVLWHVSREDLFDPCPMGFTENGLEIPWRDLNYVNPPYTLLKEFVYKSFEEADQFHRRTIMLLPSKTDQQWFHDLVSRGHEIKWIRKRLKFKNNKYNATQPHFLVMIQ